MDEGKGQKYVVRENLDKSGNLEHIPETQEWSEMTPPGTR